VAGAAVVGAGCVAGQHAGLVPPKAAHSMLVQMVCCSRRRCHHISTCPCRRGCHQASLHALTQDMVEVWSLTKRPPGQAAGPILEPQKKVWGLASRMRACVLCGVSVLCRGAGHDLPWPEGGGLRQGGRLPAGGAGGGQEAPAVLRQTDCHAAMCCNCRCIGQLN